MLGMDFERQVRGLEVDRLLLGRQRPTRLCGPRRKLRLRSMSEPDNGD